MASDEEGSARRLRRHRDAARARGVAERALGEDPGHGGGAGRQGDLGPAGPVVNTCARATASTSSTNPSPPWPGVLVGPLPLPTIARRSERFDWPIEFPTLCKYRGTLCSFQNSQPPVTECRRGRNTWTY